MFSIDKNHKLPATFAAALALMALVGATMVTGCDSSPDCNGEGLKSFTATGHDQAKEQITKDEQNGTNAGNSLTFDQGSADGYPIGYTDGYNEGYYSPTGYDLGYYSANGYDKGYAKGLTDFDAQADGIADGYNQGRADAIPLGEYDGYLDGYSDGYDYGFPFGEASCFGGSGGVTKGDQESCRTQGFEAEYASYVSQNGKRPYNRMFDIAKAANANYQAGIAVGKAQGKADGKLVGAADGFARGAVVGYNDGFVVGAQVAYENNYLASYPNGYLAGYDEGYLDPIYGYGDTVNGTGGFGDGYYDGYDDGQVAGGCAEPKFTSLYGTTPVGGHARVGFHFDSATGQYIAAYAPVNSKLTKDLKAKVAARHAQLLETARYESAQSRF